MKIKSFSNCNSIIFLAASKASESHIVAKEKIIVDRKYKKKKKKNIFGKSGIGLGGFG